MNALLHCCIDVYRKYKKEFLSLLVQDRSGIDNGKRENYHKENGKAGDDGGGMENTNSSSEKLKVEE